MEEEKQWIIFGYFQAFEVLSVVQQTLPPAEDFPMPEDY